MNMRLKNYTPFPRTLMAFGILTFFAQQASAQKSRSVCPDLDSSASAAEQALCWYDNSRRGAAVCKSEKRDVNECISNAVKWCADAALDEAPVASACFIANIRAGRFDEAATVAEYLQSPSKELERCLEALSTVKARIVSVPAAAEITVNDRYYGKAPVEVTLTGKWRESRIAARFGSGEKSVQVIAPAEDLIAVFDRWQCVMGDLVINLPDAEHERASGQRPGAAAVEDKNAPTTTAAPTVSGSDYQEADPSDQDDGPRLLPWIVIGASGAVAIGGAVMLAVAISDKSTVENAKKGILLEDIEGAHDRVPTFSTVGSIVLGAGLAGAIVGVVLLVTSAPEDTEQEGLSLLPNGLLIRGSL